MSKLVKAPFCTVYVRRGLNEEHPKTVMTHEVVLLAAVHGDDAIRVAEVQPGGSRKVDPDIEYERMESLYGSAKGSDTPYVTAIYGMRMAKLFQQSVGKKLSKFLAVPDDVKKAPKEKPVEIKKEVPAKPDTGEGEKTVSKADCVKFLESHSVPDIDKKAKADDMRDFTLATAIQLATALEITVDPDAGLADLIDAVNEATGKS